MNCLSRHINAILTSALAALSALSGTGLHAQELRIPDRWNEPLNIVPPLFSEDTLTIRIVGDVMMHEMQIKEACTTGGYDFSSYFSMIADEIRKADIAVANMEFTLAGEPYSGYPCFAAPDSFATYLADCGFDIFLAANNHIFDKGTAGAERTMKIYRELSRTKGIRFTGLASDEDEHNENNPLLIRKKGIRLAFINATYGTNLGLQTHWPQTNYLSAKEKLKTAFSKAEEADADITVALPHWGTEYVLHHSQTQESTAEWMAVKGADLIIGAHPHVIQDFQVIEVDREFGKEKIPVAYSLGNAVSNMSATNTQMGLMATIRIVRENDGDIRQLPIEFKYLWCSRPGGYNGSYTVLPVADFVGRKDEWKGNGDYEKMISTYRRVSIETGIKDKDITLNE